MLGVLLIVAIWFWAPLVSKWMGKGTDDVPPAPTTSEEANSTTSNNSVAATTSSETTTPTKTAAPKWQQILKWMRNDPHMQPKSSESAAHDPFFPSASRMVAHEEKPVGPPPTPELTPQQAGIVVQSTAIGPRTKTALINGRPYHEQQNVTAPNGHDRFLLVEIRPNGIVLDRDGNRFELKIRMIEAAAFDD